MRTLLRNIPVIRLQNGNTGFDTSFLQHVNLLVIYIEQKSGKNIEDEMIISNSYFLHHSLLSATFMTILQTFRCGTG